MIDKDIENETINMIRKFYNKIIKIDPIEIKNNNSVQQIILSKLNAFNLIEYKKIFIIDIDTIIFKNIDKYFFDYRTPSVTFLENKLNYGFILVEPSKEIFSQAINLIKKYKLELEKAKKPFEFIIKKLFIKINTIDINLSSTNYLNVYGIQYTGDKPFLMSSSLTIEERMVLNRFKIWFISFIGILNKYPEFKNIKSIYETIEVSKYFLAPISRFIIELIKLGKNNKNEMVSYIYGKQKFNKLEYYHLDISKDYSGEYINYMSNINRIKVFLQYLTDQTGIDFCQYDNYNNSKEIINFLFQYEQKKNIVNSDEKVKFNNQIQQSKILNLFLNHCLKIFSNVFVVIEFNNNKDFKKYNLIKSKTNMNEFTYIYKGIQELENNLLYKNQLNINGKILSNIIFNIFQNYTYIQKLDKLEKISIETDYLINYYIYETISQINFFDMINSKTNVFVLFDKGSKIRFSSIFFNPNTLIMFKNQHHFCNYINYQYNDKDVKINKKFINKNSLLNLIYFQTLKKWIYSTYSGNDIENVIIGELESDNLDFKIETESKNFFFNKLILIDNITTNIGRVKKIKDNKIFFIEIIFLKISQYKNILSNYKKIFELVSNSEYQWELEGIKFFVEKINL
jgi:hypothetical protein